MPSVKASGRSRSRRAAAKNKKWKFKGPPDDDAMRQFLAVKPALPQLEPVHPDGHKSHQHSGALTDETVRKAARAQFRGICAALERAGQSVRGVKKYVWWRACGYGRRYNQSTFYAMLVAEGSGGANGDLYGDSAECVYQRLTNFGCGPERKIDDEIAVEMCLYFDDNPQALDMACAVYLNDLYGRKASDYTRTIRTGPRAGETEECGLITADNVQHARVHYVYPPYTMKIGVKIDPQFFEPRVIQQHIEHLAKFKDIPWCKRVYYDQSVKQLVPQRSARGKAPRGSVWINAVKYNSPRDTLGDKSGQGRGMDGEQLYKLGLLKRP